MISYTVSQEMALMNNRERNVYSRGISQAYGAVFERIGEVLAGNRDIATLLQVCSEDFEACVAAQVVRGVL